LVAGADRARRRRLASVRWLMLVLFSLRALSAAAAPAGRVVDAASGKPLAGATVSAPETGATAVTDTTGVFRFDLRGAEGLILMAEHPFYEPNAAVWPASAEDIVIKLTLTAPSFSADTLVVQADPLGPLLAVPTPKLGGADLRRKLGGTLAATMDGMPGVSQRSMGPAPARPVVRSLSGYRAQILEDGSSPGDLSASSPDHAVAIDPLAAREVEIVRGPAALLYGSSSLGGIIRVEHDGALDLEAGSAYRAATAQLGSGDRSAAGSLRLRAPLGALTAHVEMAGRSADDLRTPERRLEKTAATGLNAVLGLGWHGAAEVIGASGAVSRQEYGIPGGFVGGHAKGVQINMQRERVDARFRHEGADGPWEELDLRSSFKRYFHEELETSGVCGVSFGVLTYDAQALARFRSRLLGKAVAGASLEMRDFGTGCLSFVPDTRELSPSLQYTSTWRHGRYEPSFGIRFDHRTIKPAAADSNKAGRIRDRRFTGLSFAAALSRSIGERGSLGLTISRSFRPPAIEELFSEGPHLAAFAYEVGNADLDPERGLGLDLTGQYSGSRTLLRVSLYRYRFDSYILATSTGELEYGPGETGILDRYQYQGLLATITGAEVEINRELRERISLALQAAGTLGHREDGRDLDQVPPATLQLRLAWTPTRWHCAWTSAGALGQARVGEFEAPTAGYLIHGLFVERSWLSEGRFQSLALELQNLADTAYRNHLSRIKSIAPEAGRSLRLTYRVVF